MSQKNSVHGIDVVGDQPADSMSYGRLFLFALGVALVVALVGMVASFRPTASNVTVANTESAIPYSHALEMQYAQPWLDKQAVEAAPAVQYSHALEMQYAQPWLDAQKLTNDRQSSFKCAENAIRALMAGCQMRETAVTPYSHALEMQYAQPWLDKQRTTDCNGRLDMMYACQNGYRP